MGFWTKVLGAGIIAVGLNEARKEKRTLIEATVKARTRRSKPCHFNGEISREAFRAIVKRGARGIRRLDDLYVKDAQVCGVVISQSGASKWNFTIDFNDHGEITGKYWIFSGNRDSEIPHIVAEKISQQISEYPKCVDEAFVKEVYRESVEIEQRKEEGRCCPYCEKKNINSGAKFCMYCGRRFFV